jgi:serine phosphatase RsbU (regulator of sigma subunit)
MFGTEQLKRLVLEHIDLRPAALIDIISRHVQQFHGRELPPDDSTLLILGRLPASR